MTHHLLKYCIFNRAIHFYGHLRLWGLPHEENKLNASKIDCGTKFESKNCPLCCLVNWIVRQRNFDPAAKFFFET